MEVTYENDHIVVRIPISAEIIAAAPPSASGKTRIVAGSGGFMPIMGAPDGVKISFTVTAKKLSPSEPS